MIAHRSGLSKLLERWVALHQPMTIPELAEQFSMSDAAAADFVVSLHKLGEAHITSWKSEPGTHTKPVYVVGAGEDAKQPEWRGRHRIPGVRLYERSRPKSDVIAMVSLLRAMAEPKCMAELTAETGMAHQTVLRGLKYLRESGMARIAEWERRDMGGAPVAFFALGMGRDAPRPKPNGQTLNRQKYWAGRTARNGILRVVRALAANEEREAA